MYIKWFVLVIINMILKYFIAYLLTPIIVLFAKQDCNLPNWLFWFMTHDNTLDGDSGWKTESRPYLNESNRYKRYVNRCYWLWRNSLYGFDHSVLGIKYQSGDSVQVIGDNNISNGPPGVSGTVKRYLHRDGKVIAWQWYYIRQYKKWPNKCIRVNLGNKLWGDISVGNVAHIAASPWFLNKFTQ
jgi:hypothetical protein